MGRPTCETPGCGKPIPKGGEGHPEICPDCLVLEERFNHTAAGAKHACLQGVVATLRTRASALFGEKKDDMENG